MNNGLKKSVRLTPEIKPKRYKLSFRPNFEDFTFYGEEVVYLSLKKPTQTITLHAQDLEIESAEYKAGKTSVSAKISYQLDDETATFTFPKAIPAGEGELMVTFKGILNEHLRGFYRSRYILDGREKYLAVTQFEATDARRTFPCFDEPAQKAIFEVSLEIPKNMVAISNTIEKKSSENELGLKVVEFEPTPNMSTYLLAFLVGEFESIEGKTKDGVLVRIFTTPGKKSQGKFALQTTIKMIEFYNNYFQIDYPLPVIDLIAVPDFAAGAMENWGAVIYRETALLIDDTHSSAVNKQRVAIIIAHELAHMWFGDLVTMEWWTHLWLNEGFASYMEYLAVDHVFPEYDIWTQFVHMDQGMALKLDSLENTHPVEVEVYHPKEITEIFDKVSYSKGASIIRMLAEYLGQKDFQKGLRLYLKKHAYSNARTEDLWASFEKASGKPVEKIMKNWTSKPGYPLLTLEESKSGLTITQRRFFSSPISQKESKEETLWQIPLKNVSEHLGKTDVFLDKKTVRLSKEKGWIKINASEGSFSRTDYPAKYLHLLKSPIENKKLEPIDRLGIIRDAFDIAESGNLATHEALRLSLDYINEDDFTIWSIVASRIAEVYNLIYEEGFRDDFEYFGRKLFGSIAGKLGWEKKKGERHTDTLLRSLSLYNLGTYKEPDTIKKARALWESGKNIEADLRGAVYGLVAENGTEADFQKFMSMHKSSDNQQEKDRIERALGLFSDLKLLKKTLDYSLSKDVRAQDAVFIVRVVGSNPIGRDITWEFIKKNWQVFQTRYGGGHFLLSTLIQTLDSLQSKEKAKEIAAFFMANPAPEAARTIAQVLEKIESNALWIKRDKDGIRKFLKDFVK